MTCLSCYDRQCKWQDSFHKQQYHCQNGDPREFRLEGRMFEPKILKKSFTYSISQGQWNQTSDLKERYLTPKVSKMWSKISKFN